MSNVEDIRKLLQDFLAPEIKEIKAELRSLRESLVSESRRLGESIDSVKEQLNQRFNSLETQLARSERVARLEQSHSQPPKKN
jgi:hypothetical protein